MIGAHHNPPMIMHIAEDEIRQALITSISPKIVKRGIKSLIILKFILITSILVMMRTNHGVENYVVLWLV